MIFRVHGSCFHKFVNFHTFKTAVHFLRPFNSFLPRCTVMSPQVTPTFPQVRMLCQQLPVFMFTAHFTNSPLSKLNISGANVSGSSCFASVHASVVCALITAVNSARNFL